MMPYRETSSLRVAAASVAAAPRDGEQMGNAQQISRRTASRTRVLSLERAVAKRRYWQKLGQPVVLTNGCFDLLHVGHVRYLQVARSFGKLIVGVNSDRSVRALKGPSRPVLSELDRAEILASLRWVDAVVIFDDATAEPLLEAIGPDTYVKGADYGAGGRPLPEADVARRLGTRVVLIDLVEGRSTTSVIDTILRGGV
jgi:D-beta-D-heptose 7-phosphate kinase / D-beta-D-heptose 1-phosphate adenosyltransferase